MRPLRFAMVTTFYPPFNFGGDGIFVQRLARALVARGHSVDVIHDTDAYRCLSGSAPEIPFEDDGVRVHRLRSPHKLWSSLGIQQLGRPTTHKERLEELLTGRYDVINYHNVSLIGGPGVWPIGTGIKLHTAHEHWLVCPSHILWRNNKEICDERRCIRCVLAHGRPPQLWRATQKMGRDADAVDAFLMLSQSSLENHERFGFKHPMRLIPSFLPDAGRQLKPAEDKPKRRPYFLFVGRLSVIKGVQDLIPQFDESVDADLLIAGTGDYENELRALAKGRRNVHFLGRKSQEELKALYADAIAVLTPSRCYEVFPMVVLEAFREGTPIIARNLGPYPEIVKATGGGMLFDGEDDLRSAIIRLSRDRKLAQEMGRKAFAGFARTWREDVALAKYFQVIEDIAEKRGMTDLLTKLSDPNGTAQQTSA